MKMRLIRLEKMGIEFKNVDLKNNEIVELEDRNKSKYRKRQENDVDKNG